MISKSELLDSIVRECRITKQLFSQVPDGGWDYRMSEGQRSTKELGQYLCAVGQGCMHAGNDGGFDWFGANSEKFGALSIEDLPGAMDDQVDTLTRFVSEMSDEDFASKKVDMTAAGMGEWTMQGWLLQTVLKFLTAYRMQFFLQAKAAGNTALDTWDCWMNDGSTPRPEPANA